MNDTIAAPATPVRPAARIIVRTSGPEAFRHAAALGAPALSAGLNSVILSIPAGDASWRIRATCYAFLAPRSHTGEDVVEYHLPGNPLIARRLLEALSRLGARAAEPGEFSARAFFNGKLRLEEAEGIAATIGAGNERELHAAGRLRAGELARRLQPTLEALADLLAMCELGIDFTEEDVTVLDAGEAAERIDALKASLSRWIEKAPSLEQLGEPPRIALVGRPNVGKSSLLNALAGFRRAVTSAQAGTTRDALVAEVELASGRVILVDLAGLADAPLDMLDAQASRRAREELATAEAIVLVRDATRNDADPALPRAPDLVVVNKIDLARDLPREPAGAMAVSALTGEGLAGLRASLDHLAFATGGDDELALGDRHRAQLRHALDALELAAGCVEEGAEVLALHLREALDALGAILGTVSPDDLLGRIFSRFCIGK